MEFDASIVEGEEEVVVLTGELDAEASLAVGSMFDQALATAGDVVVDMSGVTFMDSTGLRSLIQLQHRVAERGGTVTVRNPRPNVARVFVLSGLTRTIHLDPEPPVGASGDAAPEVEAIAEAGGDPLGPDEIEGPNPL